MRLSITATAPCRADLAGGTMDIWPLYLFHPGARTVNFALTIKTRCVITPKAGKGIHLRSLDTGAEDRYPDLNALLRAKQHKHGLAAQLIRFFRPKGGFTVETHSESPAGAGISGSSALMVATTAALAKLTGRTLDKEAMREIAQNVECQLIRVPTGCQDYYPAIYGGVSAIHLREDGFHREAVPVDLDEMDQRFVIAYTGAPRQSGINNWQVFQAHINGDKKVIRNFEEIAAIAQAMHLALEGGKWSEVERLLREEWKLRRTNAPGISTPFIDRLIAVAQKNGGRAAKVCGAGGGGCVLFLLDPGSQKRVQNALRNAGAQVLESKVSRRGVQLSSSKA